MVSKESEFSQVVQYLEFYALAVRKCLEATHGDPALPPTPESPSDLLRTHIIPPNYFVNDQPPKFQAGLLNLLQMAAFPAQFAGRYSLLREYAQLNFNTSTMNWEFFHLHEDWNLFDLPRDMQTLWKTHRFALECLGETARCPRNPAIVFVKLRLHWLPEGSSMPSDAVINLADEDILEMMNLEHYEEDTSRSKDGFEVMSKPIYPDHEDGFEDDGFEGLRPLYKTGDVYCLPVPREQVLRVQQAFDLQWHLREAGFMAGIKCA
ncbi:hypothetical protein QC762_708970 [Podospora pseudocomata]|uniref:HNH nuclease domain-containing protein n=1 Tax=Podospora pseudocomata TaxID=2093779 RepID=A0ABR0G4K3_9PEZI|nr:hypothetical protein QC762_708970 [Podospora pseudocomata]